MTFNFCKHQHWIIFKVINTETTHVQARFFGLSYNEVNEQIKLLNGVVDSIGSTSENGKIVVAAQGILQDLANYAEKMRQHEGHIESAIQRAAEARQRDGGNRKRSPRGGPRRSPRKHK